MHEDPTIPLGVDQADRPEVPPAGTSWGNFSLLARVGLGGFGEVYRAWDPHLQREVALKLLLPAAVSGDAEYEAMLREARALASVRHPNIVPVYGIDRQNGRVGFWTDFVRGKTLSALIDEQGTFGAREAALIGLDVARALSAVHRAGLLHRDIKAQNVMREQGGRILLMDFGLSSLEQRQTNIAGTPSYMAPELFEGGQSTVSTDIYAMGVLLYFLVSGEYPVALAGLTQSDAAAALAKRRPLMDLRPDLPESLLRVVNTATELDPAKRFASVGQLATALAESLGTAVPVELQTSAVKPPPTRRKQEKIYVGIALAAALVVGVTLWPGNLQRLFHSADKSELVPPVSTVDQFQSAQDLLLRSYKAYNVAEAVKGFQSVPPSDPSFALAQARLGLAYFIQYGYSHDPKLLDRSREATNRAISLNPNLAPAFITLSRLAAMQGQSALAMEQIQKALKIDRNNAEAYGALGEVHEAEGNSKDAADAYQRAIDLAPDDWRWPVRLGNNEFRAGKFKDAIDHFQSGVDLAPDNAIAYRNLGIANMQYDRLDVAQKNLETSLHIEPAGPTYSALGTVFLLQGKYQDAAAMDLKAIELNRNSYVAWGNLAAVYQWSGQHEKGLQAYRKAIELGEIARLTSREDPMLLVALADYYASIGNSAKSLVLVRQAMALDPDSTSIQYQAGCVYEALGQRDKAIPLIVEAIAHGYHANEFQRNPELAALRADSAFVKALAPGKTKNK
jgi:serine/threonine protein kinase/Tfp pilus assembly protein PilF